MVMTPIVIGGALEEEPERKLKKENNISLLS